MTTNCANCGNQSIESVRDIWCPLCKHRAILRGKDCIRIETGQIIKSRVLGTEYIVRGFIMPLKDDPVGKVILESVLDKLQIHNCNPNVIGAEIYVPPLAGPKYDMGQKVWYPEHGQYYVVIDRIQDLMGDWSYLLHKGSTAFFSVRENEIYHHQLGHVLAQLSMYSLRMEDLISDRATFDPDNELGDIVPDIENLTQMIQTLQDLVN